MANNSGTTSYLELDEARYGELINRLVSEVTKIAPNLPDANRDALHNFFAVSLTKGADFSAISFEKLAGMSPKKLDAAAQALPDKLSEASRKAFAEAAERRTATARWDSIFPDGGNDRILGFAENGQSVDDRLAAYLAAHNEAAKKRYADATATGSRDAGKTIEQREIRRDPADHAKLQTYNPKKEQWESGQKLGRFLEERNQWALLDDFKLENSKKGPAASQSGESADTMQLLQRNEGEVGWQRSHPQADNYDPSSLKILITRDPQKIGEMSSRQHWESCMREVGGVNFHYVPKDIEAGTLAAYVVSADDTQARYPLMRQLLKPYQNEAGETILVPAKVYGADTSGNSRTRDALTSTLSIFVRDGVNAGKAGEFAMDSRLYGDGQPGFIVLQKSWTKDAIEKGLMKYHDSSLQELAVELREKQKYLSKMLEFASGDEKWLQTPGQMLNEDYLKTKAEIESFKKKIATLQNPEELAKGFFRQVRKTSRDSVPEPTQILEVAQSPDMASRHTSIGAAVRDGNLEPLKTYIANTPQANNLGALRDIVYPGVEGTTQQAQATALIEAEIRKLPPSAQVVEAAKNLRMNSEGLEQFKSASINIIMENVHAVNNPGDRVRAIEDVIASSTDREITKRAFGMFIHDIQGVPDGGYRVATLKRYFGHPTRSKMDSILERYPEDSHQMERLSPTALSAREEFIPQAHNYIKQQELLKQAFNKIPYQEPPDSLVSAVVGKMVSLATRWNGTEVEKWAKQVGQLKEPEWRIAAAIGAASTVQQQELQFAAARAVAIELQNPDLAPNEGNKSTRTEWRKQAIAIIMEDTPKLSQPARQFYAYMQASGLLDNGSLQKHQIGDKVYELLTQRGGQFTAVELAEASGLVAKEFGDKHKATKAVADLMRPQIDRLDVTPLKHHTQQQQVQQKQLQHTPSDDVRAMQEAQRQAQAAMQEARSKFGGTSLAPQSQVRQTNAVSPAKPVSTSLPPTTVAEVAAAGAAIAGATSAQRNQSRHDPTHTPPTKAAHASQSRITKVAHAANAPIGVALGAHGLYDKLNDGDGTYSQDIAAGGTRATLAKVGVATDIANLAVGAADTKRSVQQAVQALKAAPAAVQAAEGAAASSVGKTVLSKVLGKAAMPIGIAQGAVETRTAIEAKDGHRAATAVGNTVGGIGVGVLTSGAVVAGAALGTAFIPIPVVGTAVGALGGLAVTVGSAILGGWLGGKAVDAAAGDAWDKSLKEPTPQNRRSPPTATVASAPAITHGLNTTYQAPATKEARTIH